MHRLGRPLALVLSLGLMLATAPFVTATTQTCRITDLGTFGGYDSDARAINNAGDVVGMYTTLDVHQHAFLWRSGQFIDLGVLPGSTYPFDSSGANGVNDRGDVIGGSGNQGVTWRHGAITPLDVPPGLSEVHPTAINDRGEIALFATGPTQPRPMPFVLSRGQFTPLVSLGGSALPTDIDSAGDVVGLSWTTGDVEAHAVMWHQGATIDLGIPAGYERSEAVAVNDDLAVAGTIARFPSGERFGTYRAVVWQGGTVRILPNVDDLQSSLASGINARGDVVGLSTDMEHVHRAVVWPRGGAPVDLTALIPTDAGWAIGEVYGINDGGTIVGTGSLRGERHGFVLDCPGLR